MSSEGNTTNREPENEYNNELVSFLSSLLAYLGDLARQLGRALLSIIGFVVARPIAFAIAFVVGVAATVGWFQSQPKTYSSTMVFTSEYLGEKVVDKMVEDLNTMCSPAQNEKLAQRFGDVPEAVDALSHFSFAVVSDSVMADPVLDLSNTKESEGEPTLRQNRVPLATTNYLHLTAYSTDAAVFEHLEAWLSHWMDNNKRLNDIRNGTINTLQNRKAVLQSELAKLDALKEIYNSAIADGGAGREEKAKGDIVIHQAQINPMPAYEQSMLYHDEIQEIEKQMVAMSNFTNVVVGFSPAGTPTWQPLSKSLMYGGVVGLIFALVFVWLIYLRGQLQLARKATQAVSRYARPTPDRPSENIELEAVAPTMRAQIKHA